MTLKFCIIRITIEKNIQVVGDSNTTLDLSLDRSNPTRAQLKRRPKASTQIVKNLHSLNLINP